MHVWRPARRFSHVVEDRASNIFLNAPVDFPHEFMSLFRVDLHRLLIYQLIDLTVAIPGLIAFGFADVVFVEILVGIIQPAANCSQRNDKIRAHQLGQKVGRLDSLDLAIKPDVL